MRRSSSASRELNASPRPGSQGNSSGGMASSSSRPASSRAAARRVEAAALDERDGVREVGQGQPVGQAPGVPDLVP